MKQIPISVFRTKCCAILEGVRKTKRPVQITRRGKPVAEVMPPSLNSRKKFFGLMKGKMDILGDIVSPVSDPDDWAALRDRKCNRRKNCPASRS